MTQALSPTQQRAPLAGSHAAAALPRLLAGIPSHGAMSLAEHLAVHGAPPSAGGRGRGLRKTSPLIERIERSGLCGRGGGGFPTARKMLAVAASRGRAIVVANGAEGEPASQKDRTLLQTLPHLVLDGAILAAEALGAEELMLCVCESEPACLDAVAAAIEEREHPAGQRRSSGARPGPEQRPRLGLRTVPQHYIAGQESALISHLNGRPAVPAFTPPMPFERGVARRPTFLCNVETFAHIALIARHGSQWFRELGTAAQPGSALVTLSGSISDPGVYEIEQGASMSSLIDAAGGTTARVRAALLGGYAGSWIGGEFLHGIGLSDEHLAPHGASLGAGVVLLLGEDACPVAENTRVARWLASQSTGQCGPCVHGLHALAGSLERIAEGAPDDRAQERIDRLASLVQRRGACGHPDGTANFILSALGVFAAEFADHARHGPCEACTRPGVLPLPATRSAASALREPVSGR
jgi:NADH:ubiquinone oxidoreductase subunit F (NADH-binding)